MKITPHFTKEEMDCPCCQASHISTKFMHRLEACRILAGVPFRVTSGFRCVKHNEEIGGHKNSAHKFGQAVDIARQNPASDRRIIDAAVKCEFIGIEIATRHIHLDMAVRKEPTIWTGISK